MRLFLSLLLSLPTARADVLIQGAGTGTVEYRAALKADADLIAPSAALLKDRPKASARETLLAAFAEAQKSFLQNSRDEAVMRFTQIVNTLTDDDWSRTDRQVFLISFLRLAQLAPDEAKAKYWLTRALTAGDDAGAENNLFPPPLIRELEKTRAETPRTEIPETWFQEGWNIILLNGRPCVRQGCPAWPRAGEKVRVTFLSDTWQTSTLLVNDSELIGLRPVRSAWALGDCRKTRLSPAAEGFQNARAFWGIACESPVTASASNKSGMMAISSTATPNPGFEQVPTLNLPNEKPVYRKPWFWGLVGAVVGGALLYAANQNRDRQKQREPSTTYGYE